MPILSNDKRRQAKDYLLVFALGAVLHFAFKWDFLKAIGLVVAVAICIDVFMALAGNLVVPLMFERIWPTDIRELKHNEKQYQYIVNYNGRDVYTVVYRQPLEKVELKCYKYMGRVFIAVVMKKKESSSK